MAAIPYSDTYEGWRLAGQLEKEWSDLLLDEFIEQRVVAAQRIGFMQYLVTPNYYRDVAGWIHAASPVAPATIVDVGAGLGRFLYELALRYPVASRLTYLEPSAALYQWASRILHSPESISSVPFIDGIGTIAEHPPSPRLSDIEKAVTEKIEVIHGQIDDLEEREVQADLVTSMNVLDQCAYPGRLAMRTMRLASPTGVVVLSNSHQFQKRLYLDESTVFASLHDLFTDARWKFIAEAEFPYVFRTGDRHRHEFLSHHVMYQRL